MTELETMTGQTLTHSATAEQTGKGLVAEGAARPLRLEWGTPEGLTFLGIASSADSSSKVGVLNWSASPLFFSRKELEVSIEKPEVEGDVEGRGCPGEEVDDRDCDRWPRFMAEKMHSS